MSTPPKYHRLTAAERREQLLDVANALLAERGYEEVTVDHIAKAAGVARGLVHHYFGGVLIRPLYGIGAPSTNLLAYC